MSQQQQLPQQTQPQQPQTPNQTQGPQIPQALQQPFMGQQQPTNPAGQSYTDPNSQQQIFNISQVKEGSFPIG
jgi:hypothetical protein